MLNIASLQQLRQHSVSVRVTHLPAQVIIELKIYRSLLFFLHAIVYSFSHLSLCVSFCLSVSVSVSLSPPVSPSPSLAVRQAGKKKRKRLLSTTEGSPALSRFVAGTADSVTERQTDKQTNRQTDRQTDRQADRQAGDSRQTDRQTGRQTDRQTDYQLAAMTHLHSPGLWQEPWTA